MNQYVGEYKKKLAADTDTYLQPGLADAIAAKGGKSIMTLYSTAKNNTITRIVPALDRGVTVTTPRMDVHYLCTEYGLVNLKHKSVGERADLIISIAHPSFRDELTRSAEKLRLF